MGWFNSTTSPPTGTKEAEQQVVELICACREKVHGIRSGRPKRVVCRKCGSVLFLLPQSPYPLPRAIQKSKSPARGKSKSNSPSSDSGKKKSSRRTRRPFTLAGAVRSFFYWMLFPFLWSAATLRTATVTAVRWMIRPLPMAVILTTIILSVTGYFVVRKWQFDRAISLLTILPEQGQRLLDEGKTAEAADVMRQVSLALQTVNRRDPESLRLMQLARELEALRNLSPTSIDELVAETIEVRGQSLLKWNDFLSRNLSSCWLVLDSSAVREDESGKPSLEIYLSINGESVRLVLDLSSSLVTVAESTPTRVILAAKIRQCESEGRLGWKIVLDPSSVVFLTDRRVYAELHMSAGDEVLDGETERLLEQQAKWVEAAQ